MWLFLRPLVWCYSVVLKECASVDGRFWNPQRTTRPAVALVRSLFTSELSSTANVGALLLAEAGREDFLNKVHLVQMTFSCGNRLCPLDSVVLMVVTLPLLLS